MKMELRAGWWPAAPLAEGLSVRAVTLNEVKGLLSDGSRFFATLRMTTFWLGTCRGDVQAVRICGHE